MLMLRLQQIFVVAVLFGITGCSAFVAGNNRKPSFWHKTVSHLQVLMPDSNNPTCGDADVENVAVNSKQQRKQSQQSQQQRQSSLTQTNSETQTEQADEIAKHPQKPETMPAKTPPPEIQSAALVEKKTKPVKVTGEQSDEFDGDLNELMSVTPQVKERPKTSGEYSPKITAFLNELQTFRTIDASMKKTLAVSLAKLEASEPAEEFTFRLSSLLAEQRKKYEKVPTDSTLAGSSVRDSISKNANTLTRANIEDKVASNASPLPPTLDDDIAPPPARKLPLRNQFDDDARTKSSRETSQRKQYQSSGDDSDLPLPPRYVDNRSSSSSVPLNSLRFSSRDDERVSPVSFERYDDSRQNAYDSSSPNGSFRSRQNDNAGYNDGVNNGYKNTRQSLSSNNFSSPDQCLRIAADLLHQKIATSRQPSYRDEAQLRLLDGMLGNKRDAVKPITSLEEPQQKFWSNEVLAITTFLETDDAKERANATVRHVEEGLRELQPLRLRNMQFVKRCDGFGQFEPAAATFSPSEMVIVYFELENVTLKETNLGYQIQVVTSYEIRDADNTLIKREDGIDTENTFKSRRRDNYFGIKFQLPETITPGKYFLHIKTTDENHPKQQNTEDRIPFKLVEQTDANRQ